MILRFLIFFITSIAAYSDFQDCLYTVDPNLLLIQEQLYGCSGQAYIGLLLCTADVLESNRALLGSLLDESYKVSSVIECLRRF